MTRLAFVSSLLLVACAADPEALPQPPSPDADGKSDGAGEFACSFANPKIAAIKHRAAPIATASLAGLRPIDGVPFPAISHDRDGFFHPNRPVTHSGTLDLETDTVGDYLEALGFDSSGFRAGRPVGVPTPYLEGGTFAVSPAPHDPAKTLRTGVWNIARGAKLDTVIENIKRMDADIWIINEGDLYGKSNQGRVAAREIARALGFSYVTSGEFYELRDDRRGLSGNAIVSRYPLSDVQTVYLPLFGGRDWAKKNALDPQARCGQRSALSARATITLTDGTNRVINLISAHLENAAQPGTRQEQLQVVREFLAVPGEPTLIGGDFNTLGVAEGTNLRADLAAGKHAPYTFGDCSHGDNTNTFLVSRIDWILAQPGDQKTLECSGYRVGTEATGSDHKPVLTQLTLR
jgi:endonuclease/exonuclease/phosphatase family metal-dependent hydrolase